MNFPRLLLVFIFLFASKSFLGQIINTIAGTGANSNDGDGGLATMASFQFPAKAATDNQGNIYVADPSGNRIRKISPDGKISTFAGTGTGGFSGDGGSATLATLNQPYAVAVSADGTVFIADKENHRVRRVSPGGIITTYAGVGNMLNGLGDNGPAGNAGLSSPSGLAIDANGRLLIADTRNNRIRRVSETGIITTIAGNGTAGYSGDGGNASSASLNDPWAICLDATGILYIADFLNFRIRKVGLNNIITTYAGNGANGFSGDGGQATLAGIHAPFDLSCDQAGNLFIAVAGNRIRRVSTTGVISTFAGTGVANFSGDGGIATLAALSDPRGVTVAFDGNILICDSWNRKLRKVSFSPVLSSFTPASAGNGTTVNLTGNYLYGATAVRFGGTNAASFTVNSPTSITAVLGSGTSGSVSVVTPGGTASRTGFTFIPAPNITSFTPTTANIGQTVTITGTHFTGTTQVQFGGVNAQSFTVGSSTSITAVVGFGLSGIVTVTTPGGTASRSGFIIPAPTITTFTPASVAVGSTVTINGTNLSGATSVTFGSTPARSFAVVNNSTISAVVGEGSSGSVGVTTSNGTASKAGFTIAAPTITSFSPTSGNAGTNVVIYGNNLSGITSVTFGGTGAGFSSGNNTGSITATLGKGSTGSVSLTTPGGTASLAGFTYTGPTITSFSPTAAFGGETVNITGTNLNGATEVTFGGLPAESFNILSSTSIAAVVGAGASGTIRVVTPMGFAERNGFVFTGPSITSFSPASAGTGSNVTISGSNFTAASSVSFGGVPASSFVINSSSTITAVVGPGANGKVNVTTAKGTAASSGDFTYIHPPIISSISPAGGKAGASITITGANFTGATVVKFGGTNASSFQVQNSTTIVAVVGAGSSGNVAVTTPGGTATFSGFTFFPAPTITSIAPTSAGPGMPVNITGTNFTGATSLSFGGVPANSFTINSATSLSAQVGETGASGNVSITTPGGTAIRAGFVFVNRPVITSFNPTAAATGKSVIITGNNFTGATAVSFGGIAASSFNVASVTQINATVAAGSASGDVSVSTPGGTAVMGGFTFIPVPTITAFSPASGVSGTTITITGQHFGGATLVRFGGTNAASFTVVSPTQIQAVAATGSSGAVSVTTPGGSASLTGFTYSGITSFSPISATLGQTVSITGTNLTGTTAVSFGGVPAASFTVISATRVDAVVAKGASGNVAVTTPAGIATRPGFTYIIPLPVVSSFTPLSAQKGNTVTITGSNFTGTTAVNFGGVPAASYTVVNNTTIHAVVGNGASGSVSVTTPDGSASKTGFTFFIPAPVISAVSPAMGGAGTVVNISGSNLENASTISFGGTAAASFTVTNNNNISATLGGGSSGSVSVTTPGGSHSFGSFTYYQAPSITSFSPASGKKGDSITLTGTNLSNTTAVSFGGLAATGFRVVSSSSVKALLGAGASGTVAITTPGGTSSLPGFTFTGPIISGFAPVTASEGDTVTISGANLSGIAKVLFGGSGALSFSVVNSTTIKAVVASGASGKVEAIAGVDTASKAGFTFVAAPSIYSFSPLNAGPGTTILIHGKNFANASLVNIGGTTALGFVVINDSTIKAETGQATQGSITVTTPAGTASLAGFMFEPGACIGGMAYIASNIAGANYQWQVNTGQGFADVTNGGNYAFAQTAILRISNVPATWAGYKYRCRVGGMYSTSFTLHISNEWKSTQNNAWENAANWLCAMVPDSNTEVVIKSGIVNINSDVRVRALKLDSAATLNIAPGKRLFINGKQALPAKIDKVGMATGQYLLHANSPGFIMQPGESVTILVRKFGNEPADSIPLGLGFTSSNPLVASVNGKGQVQALQPGFSLVEATDGAGKKAYVTVQVFPAGEVPATTEPVFAGFSRPLYILNSDVGGYIPAKALNRLGSPLNLPVLVLASSAVYEKEFVAGSLLKTPEGGYALKAKSGEIFLMGQAVMLALSANQSQGFSSSFLSAGTRADVEQMNAYSTPPPGLPQIFHVSLSFGIYPVIFTNKGLTSEPVWGNVFRLISYPIMFGQFWTGAYGIDILVLPEEVPVEVETGSVVTASGSRLVSKNPGIEKWRVIPENFIGSWNECQVYADYSGDWCSSSDTYGHSIRMRIPKAPDRIFYEGPRSIPYPANSGFYGDYYKTFTGLYAPGHPQKVDGLAQFTDNSTGVASPKTKVEIGPYRQVITGLGFLSAARRTPLLKGDVFAGMYLQYRNRSARLSWVHANEFGFEVFKPIDDTYSSWIDGEPFVRCNVVFAPLITSFSPLGGGAGTTVTINGSDFTGATAVTFGGTPAASFVVVNDNTIRAVLSDAGGSGQIRVTTAGGIAESENWFDYIYPRPTITSFSPTSGKPGTTITISGTNLHGVDYVKFGSASASGFKIVNSNTIEAKVSTSGASGSIYVSGTGGSASMPGFTFIVPPCDTVSRLTTAGNTFVSTGDWSINLSGFEVRSRGVSQGIYCNYELEDMNGGSAGDPNLYVFLGAKPTSSGPLKITSFLFPTLAEDEIYIGRGNWDLVPNTGSATATVENDKVIITVKDLEMEWFISTYYKIKISFTLVGK